MREGDRMASDYVSNPLQSTIDRIERAWIRKEAKLDDEARYKRELEHAKEMAKTQGPATPPLVWTGSKRQFGALVLELRTHGLIEASPGRGMADISALSKYFVDESGEPLKPRSIWQSLEEQAAEGKPLSLSITVSK
jgi:hypothetical protein